MKPATPVKRAGLKSSREPFEAAHDSNPNSPCRYGESIDDSVSTQREKKMSSIDQTGAHKGVQTPTLEAWELDYYAEETKRESHAFEAWAREVCGPGPWKKVGAWLLARTCPDRFASRVFGPESSLLVLLVQAWSSRVQTCEHLATASEIGYVEQCVFLMVRALRYVAPDAVRKAMRNDA